MSQTVWIAKASRFKATRMAARFCFPWPKLCSRFTLVLENVEGFVLDLPPRPAAGCEFNDVFAVDRQFGDEAIAIGRLALGVEDLDLKPVDLERIIAGP